MRIRAIIVSVALLLPTVVSAQRLPRGATDKRRPGRPTELPPQAGPVARDLEYKRFFVRSHLSVESYPLFSYVQSAGFAAGGRTSWTTFGAGTRADWRFTRFVSGTLDMTSSFLSGPAYTQTVELGTRFRPELTERRVYPFADVRVGYASSYNKGLGGVIDGGFGSSLQSPTAPGARYSSGFGGLAGAGMEIALSRQFSLTTAAAATLNRMTAHGFQGAAPADPVFTMKTLRYTIGLRYNPVHVVRALKANPNM
jgi:hypothetical protein